MVRYMPSDRNTPDEVAGSALLMPREVMKRLRVSRQTLARYVAGGHLAAVVLPSGHRRYREADVCAMERTVTA